MTTISRRPLKALGSLACAGVLALIGCSSTSDGVTAPAGTDTAPEVSGELTVYAAASLQASFDELTEGFAELYPEVTIAPTVYDGSSTLATQLISGAPADVFASADEPNMQAVVNENLIEGDANVFATNVLVIAVAPGNPLGIRSLADLVEPVDGDTPIVVLCAVEVPCGNASQDLLAAAGVELEPASEEQNVSAVLAKVQTGEADAGLVYRTDVMGAAGAVDEVAIDGSEDRPNRYPIGTLSTSENAEAAEAFRAYILSPDGQAVLEEFGFGNP